MSAKVKALARVLEFGLRAGTCRCDGWRAQGQTDPVKVGANGQGLGQCGDDLHFTATCGAFRHIDTEDPDKQACPGEAVDRLRVRQTDGHRAWTSPIWLEPDGS